MRRGGRKLSKRMSELLGIFGEGEKDGIFGLETGGTFTEDNISSLSSIALSLSSVKVNMSLSSRKVETAPTINLEHGRSETLFGENRTLLAGCDWPVVLTSTKLTTNGRTGGRKRKHCGDMESESRFSTKKLRGNWSTK